MSKVRIGFLFVCCLYVCSGLAQIKLSATVLDRESREPIVGATVTVDGQKKGSAVTDVSGRFVLNVAVGKTLIITYIGYQRLSVKAAEGAFYYLTPDVKRLGEVVVTAQESRGLAGASVIQRHAMEHLQPSSFADLLELLPGGRAHDPLLTAPNTIRLREALPLASSNYATSSLGTSFILDGAPISNNANMQFLASSWESKATTRDFTNRGADMRTIPTDDIERVEIIRGIPSVEYGDMTSGVVRIERKRGGHDLNARLKADMGSKLFHLAKGFEWADRRTLNLSIDYLDAHADPRNTLQNYQRVTLSARFGKLWMGHSHTVQLSTNLDYGGSFDREKVDPDLNYGNVDRYRSAYNRVAALTSVELKPMRVLWFKSFLASVSASYQHDLLSRTRLVQLQRETPAATTLTEGESNAVLLPFTYTASQDVDGKPLNLFAKLNARFQVPARRISNTLLIGIDWNMDKNYGRGQVFNPLRPLYPGTSARARRLSGIRAMHTVSAYAEERIAVSLGRNTFELVGGLRASEMLNLPVHYAMHGQVYCDPRVNAGWTFPKFTFAHRPSFIRIAAGVGRHTKTPTMDQLYPGPAYLDITQLNYYHSNPAYRLINQQTYIIDPTNEALRPARNLKWEISADVNVGGNRLSVTLFREDMRSGFRSSTIYSPFMYKKYDASGVDASKLTAPPSVANLPYSTMSELFGHSEYTNGSRTLKRGIEYTFASERIRRLHTRLTITGAWFVTLYHNSITLMQRPNAVVGGKQIPYAGIYKDNEGVKRQMANTNFTFDTDIPKLRLAFSLSAQCLWFTSSQRQRLSNEPEQYMSADGTVHDWKPADAQDTYLRWLVRRYTDADYRKDTVPFSMNLNLKVTKKLFGDRLNIALFCNKIWDYTPDYENNGTTIRRHVNPYFGLEMNVKI